MRTENLALFISVVQHGSFSSVAKLNDLPRANVSRRIAELEEELGVTLFNRTTRHLSLTPIGQLYYNDITVAMDALDQAHNNLKAANEVPSGKVKFGLPPSSDMRTTKLIGDFQALYPEIEIELFMTSGSYSNFHQLGLDVALHAGELTPSDLVVQKFAEFSSRIVASPQFIEQHGVPMELAALAHLPCVCLRWPDGELEDEWETLKGKVKVQRKLTTNSLGLLLKIVLDGQAAGFIPDLISHFHIDSGELINILPQYQSAPTNAYIVFPKRDGLPLANQLFIDYLKAELPSSVRLTRSM
ncbi:LysR family transcriptional regulator [Aliagarivorans taiwanensis]|uniref:LysR family transcriptional regulator n=1 Tax=Aliagarivorans taiwanensis TaxID=561966 RepID=UPI00040DE162|nr:LysR family transcriptional regulator [Aliagarivorans taiwanensis]